MNNNDYNFQPLFFSSDNGQCACEKHKINFGYSKMHTWELAEEYSYDCDGEKHFFECEICRHEQKSQCEEIMGAK